MFRPLDIPAFDIDWPMMDGRVHGLHDIRVTIKGVPAGTNVPGDIVVTAASTGSLTIAVADRRTGVVDNSTALTMTGLTGRGVSYGFSNAYMEAIVITDGTPLSKTTGALRVMPTCVLWLCPSAAVFRVEDMPIPREGWSRTIDEANKVVTYEAGEVGTTPPTPNKLAMINGLSTPDLILTSDGAAIVTGNGGTVSIAPVPAEDEQ